MLTVKLQHITEKFSNYFSARNITEIVDKRTARTIKKLMKGIIIGGSNKISEIGRCQERGQSKGLSFFYKLKSYYYFYNEAVVDREKLWDAHIETTGKGLGYYPVIGVDYTAIAKEESEMIENIQYVYDARKKHTVKGIKALVSVGITRTKGVRILMSKPSSSKEDDYMSENKEIIEMIKKIESGIDRPVVYAMDRGMDRLKIFEALLEERIKFLIRIKTGDGSRHLIDVSDERKKPVQWLVRHMHCPYKGPKVCFRDKIYETYVGVKKVRIPGRSEPLYLVVSRIPGVSTIAILTNMRTEKGVDVIKRVKEYQERGKVEETIRFLKSELGMETFMLRSWEGLQRMMLILTLAGDFICWLRRFGGRLVKKICAFGQTIFENRKVNFLYYRIRRGMSLIFKIMLLQYSEP